MACLFLLSGNIWSLITYFSFFNWLCIGMAILGMIIWRFKYPELERPVKMHISLPIIFFLASAFLVVMAIYAAPMECLIGMVMALSGVPVYFITIRFKHLQPQCLKIAMDNLTRNLQSILMVVPQK